MNETRILLCIIDPLQGIEIRDRLTAFGYQVPRIVSATDQLPAAVATARPDLAILDLALVKSVNDRNIIIQLEHETDTGIVYLTDALDNTVMDRIRITNALGFLLRDDSMLHWHSCITMAMYHHQTLRRLRNECAYLRSEQDAIKKSDEERFRQIIEKAPFGIALVRPDLTAEYINQSLFDITGYSLEEIPNAFVFMEKMFPDPTIRERIIRLQDEDLAHPERAPVREFDITVKDGSIKTVRVSAIFLNDGRTAVLHEDLSEQRRAEKNRREMELRMLEAQKLESLGLLAGGIAHDINNILLIILGNADLALEGLPADSSGRNHILEIEKASFRAADLCRQLLGYSGKGTILMELLQLDQMVRDMTDMLKIAIPKNISMRYNFAKEVPLIEADVSQLRQIAMNLVMNAAESIQGTSGTITISIGGIECSSEQLKKNRTGELLNPGLYVFLDVSDTGCGMEAPVLERIFDPFYSTKITGRGLGLAAVLGIVRGHHGHIGVRSIPGEGTTFSILLPAAPIKAIFSKP